VAHEVRYESTTVVHLEPQAVMATPTAEVRSRAGLVLTSPTPVADAVSTTVSASTSATAFTAASGTGITAGRRYLLTCPAWAAIVRVRSCVSTTVTLTDTLPGIPPTGTTVEGLDVAVTLSGAATATLGESFRVTVASGELRASLVYDVARSPFVGPVTADAVREYLADHVPNHPRLADIIWHARVADTCNERLRSRLRVAERYLDRYWDPDTFVEPGQNMLALVMAESHGVYGSRQADPAEWLKSQRFETTRSIDAVLLAGGAYDQDDDGAVSDDESTGFQMLVAGRG